VKINNRKCVSRVSIKNLFTTKTRCIVSVIAIALTTILFTSLFTILMTMAKGFEESNFRQVGTYSHGEFKDLTEEQYNELCTDEKILAYGLRRIAGVTTGEAFTKSFAEISYMDKNTAKWSYCTPDVGSLPKENTNEATVDTKVLACLGIEPETGKSFTLEMDLDGTIVTEEFVLSGWWEYDEAAPASHVLIPESRLEELFSKYNVQFNMSFMGTYGLDVMLKSDYNIEGQLVEILERHGFSDSENEISIGVNWGYMSENFAESLDFDGIVTIAVILLFIVFTGYLIIYNIFRISVANDIRHYGMLKTIGTTQTQIKRMVHTQAMILSAIGIPIGMIIGWITGSVFCPVVMSELNIYKASASVNPWIFVFAAVFAWITVMISCFRPARTAGKVSPVEALRYTEQASGFGNRSGKKGVSLFGMAMARLTGNKGKTVLVIASLALSIVTFTLTFILANSFSMEKYLSDIPTDFIIADSNYFAYKWNEKNAISLEENEFLRSMDGVTDSFVTYGIPVSYSPETYFSKEAVREMLSRHSDEGGYIDGYIANGLEADGTIAQKVQILGLDSIVFSKLKIYEGDMAKLAESGYIAVEQNDYFKLGDKLTFLFTDKYEYINTETNAVYTEFDSIPISEYEFIEIKTETHKVEYEIAAVIDVPYTLGYRFSIDTPLFITNNEDLFAQSNYCKPLYIAFDTTDEAKAEMEKFLADYTETNTLSYISRATEEASFKSFKRMFVILGVALSIIVGLIGLLNFINTMITSINSRQREIAALQAIGMTGRQLCTMLIWEGVIYIFGAAIVSLLLSMITIPFGNLIEEIFTFCDYSFTILPLVTAIPVFTIIGTMIPAIIYKNLIKKSIVERLRENE